MSPSPEDDFPIAMGLESCWVRPSAAEELIEAGLVEYSLFQDPEDNSLGDGLVPCDGVTPDEVWKWLRKNGSGHDSYIGLAEDE